MQPVPSSIADAIETSRLPSMPQVLLRFLRAANGNDASVADLARLAGQDPALSAHVLIAAGSAGLTRESVPNILEHCIAGLGTSLVRTMGECLAIQSVFGRALGEQAPDLTGFWSHSLLVAELARGIASRLGREDHEEAYLAGLLHDIGQLLLLDGMGARYAALLAWSRDEDFLLGLERPELGTDHAAAGAWMIDQWHLPSFIADAVLFHHCSASEIATADGLSRIVWAAHAASAWAGKEPAGRDFESSAIESSLGLPVGAMIELHREASMRVAQVADVLGVGVVRDATLLPRSSQASFEAARPTDQGETSDRIEMAVREMALMEPLRRTLQATSTEAEALQAIRESTRILFGFGRVAFLLAQEDSSALSGARIGNRSSLLERIEVPLRPGHSQAAAAALDGLPTVMLHGDSSDRPHSLADVQIARALGCEGVMYVPMKSQDRLLGIVACGVTGVQSERGRKRMGAMTRFAHLAAISLQERRDALTREKRIEAELTGRFEQHARQVAHEAGNPLSIITNYLKIVSDRLPHESGVRREMGILKEEIDRVGQIVRRIGDMTHRPSPVDTVDVNAVIEGMAALYRESLFSSRGVTLDLVLDDQLTAIPGSRDQIKQILLNLWKNAAEAMSAGGRVVVSTSSGVLHAGREYAEIRVTDSGPGLPIDVIQHMFQPLDPGRRPGHAGMGLSIVSALVKGLGGQITFQTRAGQGTTFVVLLPKSEGNER